jgi:nitrite reductase (NAD(P)H)
MIIGPLHKRNFKLDDGQCLNDDNYSVMAFEAQEQDGEILLLLPDSDELDAVMGTSKWMIRQATAEMFGRGGAGQIEIIGPDGRTAVESQSSCGGSSCGDKNLEW